MSLDVGLVAGAIDAEGALEGLLACVDTDVLLQVRLARGAVGAGGTGVRAWAGGAGGAGRAFRTLAATRLCSDTCVEAS